ncbi:hypothetical protein LshimejAT787_2100090 [Lyophyllum shimeji]|uniref:Uncharacterized protein n=1 Tax=Lyophyllum shimeji TaxID=47721 RepID=A0A9P3URM2_LYOSH|nr:hypothetical protein LshimejAT787_2100090 [Lyophyllum shimeji]
MIWQCFHYISSNFSLGRTHLYFDTTSARLRPPLPSTTANKKNRVVTLQEIPRTAVPQVAGHANDRRGPRTSSTIDREPAPSPPRTLQQRTVSERSTLDQVKIRFRAPFSSNSPTERPIVREQPLVPPRSCETGQINCNNVDEAAVLLVPSAALELKLPSHLLQPVRTPLRLGLNASSTLPFPRPLRSAETALHASRLKSSRYDTGIEFIC